MSQKRLKNRGWVANNDFWIAMAALFGLLWVSVWQFMVAVARVKAARQTWAFSDSFGAARALTAAACFLGGGLISGLRLIPDRGTAEHQVWICAGISMIYSLSSMLVLGDALNHDTLARSDPRSSLPFLYSVAMTGIIGWYVIDALGNGSEVVTHSFQLLGLGALWMLVIAYWLYKFGT